MEPGWIHHGLAQLTLRVLSATAEEKTGRPLDVGEASGPAVDAVPHEGVEPAELLARVYAHAGRRVPFADKVAKRFEGQDKRSGVGSDLLALAAQLYRRNESLIRETVQATALTTLRARKGEAPEPVPGPGDVHEPPPHWGGPTIHPEVPVA